MLLSAFSVIRSLRPFSIAYNTAKIISRYDQRGFSTLNKVCCNGPPSFIPTASTGHLVNNKQILEISKNLNPVPVRTVIKFSLKKGKRKTVKAATRRFFRLHWGGWIRPRVARQKKLWKKSPARIRRLKQHVFVNATQATLLDKMVTKFWKRPKYYVDDPYAPYHNREEYYATQKKPKIRS